jgi:hypothetical protein
MVCLRNISINTVHKGDDDDDDDDDNNNPIEFFITNALGQEPKDEIQREHNFLSKKKLKKCRKGDDDNNNNNNNQK